jgi:hypothetical protein
VTGIFEDANNLAHDASTTETAMNSAGAAESRRVFLAQASRVAIAAPSAALLLAAATRQSLASPYGNGGNQNGQGGNGNGQGGHH